MGVVKEWAFVLLLLLLLLQEKKVMRNKIKEKKEKRNKKKFGFTQVLWMLETNSSKSNAH